MTTTPTQKYLDTLKLYYEEEVEGEAYFDCIAERLDYPDHKQKMRLMARVENYAAASVFPLLEKYGLTPRPSETLSASGKTQAEDSTTDWSNLIAGMRKTFPGYIDDFEGVEAMAPVEDLPMLKILTAHEVAAIKFLELEAKGEPGSANPMHHYLKTGTA
jgi:dimethylamine/trimethylamine dehydrogenase